MPFFDLNAADDGAGDVALERVREAMEAMEYDGGWATARLVKARLPRKQDDAPRAGKAGDRVFRRLTFECENAKQMQWMADPKNQAEHEANAVARMYDVLAVRPTSAEALAYACRNAHAFEVLSIDLGTRLPFRLANKPLAAARDAGVALEVSYGPALRGGPTARRQLFANAYLLAHALGVVNGAPLAAPAVRRRAILLTSAATRPEDLRAPRDAANLATLFGLTADGAIAAVSATPQAVLRRGAARRAGVPGVLAVEKWAAGDDTDDEDAMDEGEGEGEGDMDEDDGEVEDGLARRR